MLTYFPGKVHSSREWEKNITVTAHLPSDYLNRPMMFWVSAFPILCSMEVKKISNKPTLPNLPSSYILSLLFAVLIRPAQDQIWLRGIRLENSLRWWPTEH